MHKEENRHNQVHQDDLSWTVTTPDTIKKSENKGKEMSGGLWGTPNVACSSSYSALSQVGVQRKCMHKRK